jgi:hypothetical protein
METKIPVLRQRQANGGQVRQQRSGSWHLEIPASPPGKVTHPPYSLAQLDDTTGLARRDFRWQPPLRFSLRGRASAADLPGTWGFGLWNDPFGLAIIQGSERLRLPTLPNAAWFFFASPENYLSLRDDLPANGALAASFQAKSVPAVLLLPGGLGLPLLLWRRSAQLVRRFGRRFVQQAAVRLPIDPREWHTYELDWQVQNLVCRVDGADVLETRVTPEGPLGLVLWVDNQYAAFPPDGRPRFGTLPNPHPAWIEIVDLQINPI